MKSLTFLVVLAVLATLASAATPYDGLYAYLLNLETMWNVASIYSTCLYGTFIHAFLFNDGGYALLTCLFSLKAHDISNID
jgi:hypothetical protein